LGKAAQFFSKQYGIRIGLNISSDALNKSEEQKYRTRIEIALLRLGIQDLNFHVHDRTAIPAGSYTGSASCVWMK
jgi:hypothetical protein